MTVLGLTCLRNEAPYIVDWLAHHRALGMDHVLVLTHDCDDGSDVLLGRLADAGVVTHERFVPEGDKTVQWTVDVRAEMEVCRGKQCGSSEDVIIWIGRRKQVPGPGSGADRMEPG